MHSSLLTKPRFRGLLLSLCLLASGCHPQPAQPLPLPPVSRRDINLVLADHDQALLAIPGVVGVYVGMQEDRKTPCLRVMAVRKTPELLGRVPKLLEGYPVVIEESGAIRPFRDR